MLTFSKFLPSRKIFQNLDQSKTQNALADWKKAELPRTPNFKSEAELETRDSVYYYNT
jgi:hypothetical protein